MKNGDTCERNGKTYRAEKQTESDAARHNCLGCAPIDRVSLERDLDLCNALPPCHRRIVFVEVPK